MKRRIFNRRTLLMLMLLLAGGAIVNIAVAWGTALRLPAPVEKGTTHQLPLSDGMIIVQNRQGDLRVTAHRRGTSIFADRMLEIDHRTFEQMLPRGSNFHNAKWIDDQFASAMRLGGRER